MFFVAEPHIRNNFLDGIVESFLRGRHGEVEVMVMGWAMWSWGCGVRKADRRVGEKEVVVTALRALGFDLRILQLQG